MISGLQCKIDVLIDRSLEYYAPISNPYNSSMYRMAASHRESPRRLFLQKFVSNEIIPPYVIEEVGYIAQIFW